MSCPANPPRVAFFPDSFHEVNGVAHTSRNFVDFARRRSLPFLCIRAAAPNSRSREIVATQTGDFHTLDLPRSRAAVSVEKDLSFDPLFARHHRAVADALRRFRPDLIHITGPSELGIFGASSAHRLRLPLAASWHTNVHEYAARRTQWLTRHLPPAAAAAVERRTEAAALAAIARFYRLPQLLFAPNAELCALLERRTGRPCHRMQRGVDTELFSPARRPRPSGGAPGFVLGYVGRLSVEKNVHLLVTVARKLHAMGVADVRFLVVGHGSEEAALRSALPHATFAGVLRGQALAEAYREMDLFVFPSHTDTFGNVVLEALASGVPAVVTTGGGPRFIVEHGVTGVVAADAEFAPAIAGLLHDPELLDRMRLAARSYALGCSWDAVFEGVYRAYRSILPGGGVSAEEDPRPA